MIQLTEEPDGHNCAALKKKKKVVIYYLQMCNFYTYIYMNFIYTYIYVHIVIECKLFLHQL